MAHERGRVAIAWSSITILICRSDSRGQAVAATTCCFIASSRMYLRNGRVSERASLDGQCALTVAEARCFEFDVNVASERAGSGRACD